MQRYFLATTAQIGDTVELPADVSHHLIDVMRAQVGSQIEVVLANQQAYLATITTVKPAQVTLNEALDSDSELPVNVILVCGLPKTKEKPELIVQKATELGAHQIVFFAAERSVSRWTAEKVTKKLARLQKIANGAAEQSHRQVQPSVHYVKKLTDVLDQFPAQHRLVAWEESAKQGETSALVRELQATQPGETILAIFGPEGGLSETEINQLTAQEVVPAGLGPRILRTETAPLYFMSAVSVWLELN